MEAVNKKQTHLAQDQRHVGDSVWQNDQHSVIDCQRCGYKHILPLPTPESLEHLYEEEFYQSDKERYLIEAKEDLDWKEVEYRSRYAIAESLLDKDTPRTVFDIGCGPGDFLHVGLNRGWRVQGLEPSPVATAYANERGLHVESGFFNESIADAMGSFDFVHMSEVLEHVLDPGAMLRLARKVLNDNGVLCISVPNDFNPFQKAVVSDGKRTSWWVQPDHHINYFSFSSLSALLEKNGFVVRKTTTNFPMEMFLLMGQDYSVDPELGRKMHTMRKHFDIALSKFDANIAEQIYSKFAEMGLGRLAIIFASKKTTENTA